MVQFFELNIPSPTNIMHNDWQWQLQNALKSKSALQNQLTLTPNEEEALQKLENAGKILPLTITPHYFSLIDPNDPNDPLRRQVIPQLAEFADSAVQRRDPLGEEDHEVVPHLVHRYPDRVLLLLTDRCASYCRFCTRKRWVGQGPTPTLNDLEQALSYIAANPQIKEVIVSGGDPLMLSDAKLEAVLLRLREIKSVEIIRIHTRMLTFAPMRINSQLLGILQKVQPLFIVGHFNHSNEISPRTAQALTELANHGVPVLNQSVLLKGINDEPAILEKLFRSLVRLRVRPYYLHHCDLAPGVDQFRVPLQRALEIMKALQGNISGLCLPKFVIDIPGGFGKVPLTPNSIVKQTSEEIVLEGFAGEQASYPLQ